MSIIPGISLGDSPARALNATVGRNLEETFRQLQAFQFVRDTGKVTPAGWKHGEEGIEPRIENAGRI
jgi:alkyl hydroperoxide reductase subunit AhpC